MKRSEISGMMNIALSFADTYLPCTLAETHATRCLKQFLTKVVWLRFVFVAILIQKSGACRITRIDGEVSTIGGNCNVWVVSGD